MNNVNTQELARAVVTDGTAANVRQAASSPAQSGKVLPDGGQSQEVKVEQPKPQAAEVRTERVEQAVARLNDYVQSLQRDLRFSIDNDLGRAVVSVIDRQSQEVIRQIPNETALRLARNLKDQLEQSDLNNLDNGIGVSLGLINTRI